MIRWEHRSDRPSWHPDDCNGACCWRHDEVGDRCSICGAGVAVGEGGHRYCTNVSCIWSDPRAEPAQPKDTE